MIRILRRQILRNNQRRRMVNTWSSLAMAFNNISTEKDGFNWSQKECGLFGIPELKTAEGMNILKHHAISQTELLIEEATSNHRKRKMVEIFDEISDVLCKVADMAEFVRVSHPDIEFVRAAEDACISVSGIVERLNTDHKLYNALREVANNGDNQKTSPLDDHVAKLFLFDFEQSGIHLPDARREKVVELNDYILQVGQKFMAGTANTRSIHADHLPENIRQHFIIEHGHVIVNGLYSNSPNTRVREAAYKLYLYPDNEQEYLLQELLNSRHYLAELCGFPSYVHKAVRGSTVETPTVVQEFLNILNNDVHPKALQDYNEMQKIKDAESTIKQDLMMWDTVYFSSLARRTWLDTSNAEFAPYFSLGACMDGLNNLTQMLYGITLKSVPVQHGEVWANDIQKIAVIDEENRTLGYIYCDFFMREGKVKQDCHFTIRGGKQLANGSYQNPIAVLMLSLPSPQASSPCLLNPCSVDNLFHEMGHALHSMLGRTQYQHVTGTRCSTDFAEVPSVLMEYFASDARVLSTFAKHFKTQQPIPENLLQKLCISKNIFCASELQNQIFYSMLDHVYHSGKLQKSTTDILKDVQEGYYGLPYVKNTAWQLRFSHLVGYGAKYYSYLISRAIASWIWQTYFKNDPFSRSAGDRYREQCLAHGGGKPSSKLVSDFLNKEANAQNFAKSLLQEIDIKNEQMQFLRK